MTIEGREVEQITPSAATARRGARYMSGWTARERDKPGFWVLLTKRIYAYREHTGDITYWRTK